MLDKLRLKEDEMRHTIYELNYVKLVELNLIQDNLTIENEPFMRLHVEKIGEGEYAMSHTYEQNGDLMRDPEITFKVSMAGKTCYVEALTYRQDNLCINHEVYTYDDSGNRKGVYLKLKKDINAFLGVWLRNLKMQGFRG
jgi:uncharacterized protein YqiB (DUF1249 family)